MSAFSEVNRQVWNDLAADYNSKAWQVRISQQVETALRQRATWIGAKWLDSNGPSGQVVRLLDYACGTGSITNALGAQVTAVRGIDISENMVQRYNDAVKRSGMTVEQANAVVGDLFASTVADHISSSEYFNFDIAVVGLGFHHFDDPGLALKRLAQRVKANSGVVVIVDFLPFDSSPGVNSAKRSVKTAGFTMSQMKNMFTSAGLEEFRMDVLDEPAVMEFPDGTKERKIFIARGKKENTAWGKLSTWVSVLQEKSGQQVQMQPRNPVPAKLSLSGGTSK